MLRIFIAAALFTAAVPAQRVDFRRETVRQWSPAAIRGGALLGASGDLPARVISWGDQIRLQPLPKGRDEITVPSSPLGPGGCLADIDQDGQQDIVAMEPGAGGGTMVWLQAPEWKRRVIDTGANFRDCLSTMIFAQRGILIVHQHAQVRFYPFPADLDAGRWQYRELYSIYTPSNQAGLLRADIDGDGHGDILCGNYWLKSPDTTDGSWRLFAINQWWDGPRSAMLRTALAKPLDTPFPVLFAAQIEGSPARLAWFERPADPRQLWNESPLDAMPPLRRPAAMAVADLNGDLRPDLAVGENAGSRSRLLIYWGLGGGKYQAVRVDMPGPLGELFATDADQDGDMDLVGLSRNRVLLWRAQRRK